MPPTPRPEPPEAAIRKTLLLYYRYIAEKDFASAYAMRSRACQARKSMDQFENDYRNNHGVNLMRCKLLALNGNRARALVVVEFRDTEGGVTKPVRYQGTIDLALEDGEWRFDAYKLVPVR